MPQDGTFISATPYEMTDEFQALRRTPAVRHHNRRGFSQAFRGVVGTNQTVTLHTSWPVNWTPNLSGVGVRSELTITTSTNRVGTGTTVSHEERVAGRRENASKVSQVRDAASRLNRIQGIIRAPIDQILQMEIVFGDEFSGENTWQGMYASNAAYALTTVGPAAAAMIKLTCNNPLNPGPFNFQVSITLVPPPRQAAAQPPSQERSGFLYELSDVFWDGIRSIEKGELPF